MIDLKTLFATKKRIALAACTALLLGVAVTYLTVVLHARFKTPGMVYNLLRAEKMELGLTDVSRRQVDILLAVEDPIFFRHKGVDLRSAGAGITTISQALVKIFYFEQFRPGVRKIKQTLIARYAFDSMTRKDDILRLFLNYSKFGFDVQGFGQAARFYFDKPFAELTEDEYITIVAMLIAPRTYCPKRSPEKSAERVARIKKLINGECKPTGLMDILYEGCATLPAE